MCSIPSLKFVLSLDTDILIYDESDQIYRFVRRRRLFYWLLESQQSHNEIRIDSLVGAAIAATAFTPGTVYWRIPEIERPPSAIDHDLCLAFRLQNGVNLAYVSRDAIIEKDSRWFGEHGISVAAGPSRTATCSDFPPTRRLLTQPPNQCDDWLRLRILRKIQFQTGCEVSTS